MEFITNTEIKCITTKDGRREIKIYCCKVLFIYLFVYLFIYFWLHWVFVAAYRLSLVAASRGYSSLRCTAFSLRCFSCCRAQALGVQASVVVARRLSSCGSRALECRLSNCGTGV